MNRTFEELTQDEKDAVIGLLNLRGNPNQLPNVNPESPITMLYPTNATAHNTLLETTIPNQQQQNTPLQQAQNQSPQGVGGVGDDFLDVFNTSQNRNQFGGNNDDSESLL
jgi:hypothetical protein